MPHISVINIKVRIFDKLWTGLVAPADRCYFAVSFSAWFVRMGALFIYICFFCCGARSGGLTSIKMNWKRIRRYLYDGEKLKKVCGLAIKWKVRGSACREEKLVLNIYAHFFFSRWLNAELFPFYFTSVSPVYRRLLAAKLRTLAPLNRTERFLVCVFF